MRISWGGFLVVVAVMVPIVIELRTVFVHLGVEMSIAQTGLLAAVMIGALLAWAVAPDIRGRKRSNEKSE
ncbi:MAG: membrane associated rhomboid family serine protease [Natronomonas sp.]|jgi:membrane associated rhomboid family serine protease|uniref:CbaC protein n=1 Tax=Natronomonas sp. TaxID=2184060 RepID=UPI0039892A25